MCDGCEARFLVYTISYSFISFCNNCNIKPVGFFGVFIICDCFISKIIHCIDIDLCVYVFMLLCSVVLRSAVCCLVFVGWLQYKSGLVSQ